MFVGLLPISKKVSEENKGQRDAKPHRSYAEHGRERDGTAGMFSPDEKVNEDSDTEDYARIEGGG